MAKKKVALVIDCRMINASGIGTYLKNIVSGLIASGEFNITVMGKEEELKQFPWFTKASFIGLKAGILSIYEQVELPLKIPKCDIYWSPNINGAILHTKAKNRVTTIHDVYHLAYSNIISKYKLLFIKLLVQAGIFHSKCVITVSNFSKFEILKYLKCPAEKIKVCYEAVANDFNQNFKYKKIEESYILFVGNVKPHKNLENALAAFKRLNNTNLFFYIVGQKEGFTSGAAHTQKLEKLVDELKAKVFFTGKVSDAELKNFFANAKAFIFPSTYEGFGLPVLEAMKFNIPVIASNAASIPEVGGSAIIYFNPYDIEDIKEKMELVTSVDYTANVAGYKQQLAKFNWNKTIKEHVDLFLSIT